MLRAKHIFLQICYWFCQFSVGVWNLACNVVEAQITTTKTKMQVRLFTKSTMASVHRYNIIFIVSSGMVSLTCVSWFVDESPGPLVSNQRIST